MTNLEELARAVEKESDALNDRIAAFQCELAELRLGITATAGELSYKKRNGQWALWVGNEQLIQASRETRINAVELFPALLQELELRAKELLTRLRSSSTSRPWPPGSRRLPRSREERS